MASSSVDRSCKLRKLETLKRKVPHVTASALAAVLKEIEEQGAPGLNQRKHIRECTEKYIGQHVSHGPMLKSIRLTNKQGVVVPLLIVNFFTFFQALLAEATSFANMVSNMLQQHPGALDLLVYADEVNPGNVLHPEQSRKLWMIYISIAQLGPIILSKEQSWLPLLCQRSEAVNALPGGISQITAALLEDIFCSTACDVQMGVLMKMATGSFRLKLRLGAFVADGGAHKYLFNVKGDGATRCCILCKNIISKYTDLGVELLSSKIYREDGLDMTTDREWHQSLVRLLEKKDTLNQSDFKLWQQACGITWNAHAMIFNPNLVSILKPVSQWLHDWMHCFLLKGVWSLCCI